MRSASPATRKTPVPNDSAAAVKVFLKNPKGEQVDVMFMDLNDTIGDIKKLIYQSKVQLHPSRQRLTVPRLETSGGRPVVLEDAKTVGSYKFVEGDSIVVKDLGPQISWRTVFIVEYLGPLLIHQVVFFYFLIQSHVPPRFTQLLAYSCVTFHFAKREYESLFVHRFSKATMPFRNLFKNCGHYWILSGLLMSYFLYRPSYEAPRLAIVLGALPFFIVAELGNFFSHIVLRDLRPAGSTIRAIPHGFLFDYVSCPNYTFEILAWIAFAVMTGSWTCWLFVVVSSAQMYVWAVKKHRAYRHEFPNYPKNRKILIPFVL